RFLGDRKISRHAGEALLQRHVRETGFRRRCPSQSRYSGRGRSVGRRRLGVSEEMPGKNERSQPGRTYCSFRVPQHAHRRKLVQERHCAESGKAHILRNREGCGSLLPEYSQRTSSRGQSSHRGIEGIAPATLSEGRAAAAHRVIHGWRPTSFWWIADWCSIEGARAL